jgi:hypothetical protein
MKRFEIGQKGRRVMQKGLDSYFHLLIFFFFTWFFKLLLLNFVYIIIEF